MASGYTVAQLRLSDAEQSYPLLYGAAPAVMIDKWQQFCAEERDRKDRNILVVRNAAGYIQGLCAYFEVDHISRGRLIEVPIFVVASAADPDGIAEELVGALTHLCKERDCAAVRLASPPKSWSEPYLLRGGERGNDDAVYFIPERH